MKNHVVRVGFQVGRGTTSRCPARRSVATQPRADPSSELNEAHHQGRGLRCKRTCGERNHKDNTLDGGAKAHSFVALLLTVSEPRGPLACLRPVLCSVINPHDFDGLLSHAIHRHIGRGRKHNLSRSCLESGTATPRDCFKLRIVPYSFRMVWSR